MALALLAALLATPMIRGPEKTVYADAVVKPTHVVMKLDPSADLGEVVAYANTAPGLKGDVSVQSSFGQTTIHVLTGEGWDPKAVAAKLNQRADITWAEAGMFTPTVEAEAISQASFEQFSAAAFESFSAAAFEQFSAAAFESFSAAAFEGFSQAFFEAFSQAFFESFSQTAFETFSAAAFEAFSQAFFEAFSQVFFESFSQAFFEAFSQAVFEQFVAAMTAALDAPEFRAVIDQLATDLILSIRSWQQTNAEGQVALGQINAAEAKAHATGTGVVVAIVDTGIALDHWFFDGAIAPGGIDLVDGDLVPNDEGDGIDNNGNGLIDEGVGHGTLIAGLVRMVAPDAKLLPIRVQNSDGGGWSFIIAEGIYKAVDGGADVINISLSIPEQSWVLEEAIQYAMDAGVVVVAAAGNDGVLGDLFPAASNSANVVGVAAVDSAGVLATFSNYGLRTVDVAAPGVDLYGPYPGGTGMAYWSGTSFSAGLVSGEIALAREKYGSGPRAAAAARATAILEIGEGVDLGAGVIDALGAVSLPPDSVLLTSAWEAIVSNSAVIKDIITESDIESVDGPTLGTPTPEPEPEPVIEPSGADDQDDGKSKKAKKSKVDKLVDKLEGQIDKLENQIVKLMEKLEKAKDDKHKGKKSKADKYQGEIDELMGEIDKLMGKIETAEAKDDKHKGKKPKR